MKLCWKKVADEQSAKKDWSAKSKKAEWSTRSKKDGCLS